MSLLVPAAFAGLLAATVTPSPGPVDTGPPPDYLVSPGILGFLVTFGLAVATVLLVLSMVRRLRRLRYAVPPAPDPSPDTSPGASRGSSADSSAD